MSQRTTRISRPILAPVLALGFALAAAADPAAALWNDAKLNLDLRYRLELVSQDGFSDTAQASTLRARLGAVSGTVDGFSVATDFEVIGTVLVGDYNSTANGLTQFPTVADPTGSELNQGYLQWKDADWQLRYGRQRFVLGNQRFIGNVGFRQNEQTFDALSAVGALGSGTFTGAWIYNVDRIFGADHPNPLSANTPLDAWVLDYGLPLARGKLSLYAQLFEYQALPANSHRNLGVRWAGDASGIVGSGTLRWALEYAQQDRYAQGSAAIDQDYTLIEVGYGGEAYGFRLGREVMGGDGVRGFQTPFATLHAFDGWADRFLTTPPDGLVDTYLKVDWKHGAWSAVGFAHAFRADHGGATYGTEFDLGAYYAFDDHTTLKCEYAEYAADSFATNTTILWLTAELKY